LEIFDKETKKLINDEGKLYKGELNKVATIRDDALDLMAIRSTSHDSDYKSDYESDSSVIIIQRQYANFDSKPAKIKIYHSRFICNALYNLSYNYANTTLKTENDSSCDEAFSNVQTKYTVEAGPPTGLLNIFRV